MLCSESQRLVCFSFCRLSQYITAYGMSTLCLWHNVSPAWQARTVLSAISLHFTQEEGRCKSVLFGEASTIVDPQVTPAEAQMANSGWPSIDGLKGIQQQCVDLSLEMKDQQYAAHRQVKKLCSTLLCVLHTTRELQVRFRH